MPDDAGPPDAPVAPDWRREVAARLRTLRESRIHAAEPTCDDEIVEELSQHLQDRYDELRRVDGLSDREAQAAALSELDARDEEPISAIAPLIIRYPGGT